MLVIGSSRPIGLDYKFRDGGRRLGIRRQGAVAQLGERLICIQEVAGSIPTSSTSLTITGPVAQLVRAHP